MKDPKKKVEKCKASPYYFAVNYFTVNGEPFKASLNERDFNRMFKELSGKSELLTIKQRGRAKQL